ncbi:4-hydroxy-3-methylbut-2-enyl diphosphate reductase [Candidatus Poribacteria bacterium]|nr:4-hydroxy-3-methylbut-2-enyl diphosphate reductase [Candidatus Poribacteria bacterium]
MKIILAENAGFCFGVKRAMKLAFEAAKNSPTPIYSLGPLIHNPQQVQLLTQSGVQVVSDLDSLTSGDTIIIRSHGTNPETLQKAKCKGLNIVNATCPFVVKAQELAQILAQEEYQVVIIGEGNHPEVIGLTGFAGENVWVVENAEDAAKLPEKKRIGIVAQTTQSLDNLRKVVSVFLGESDEVKVFNTICHATALRQKAALALAKEVDLMIVIGGYNSANTNRLASLCKETGVHTYHIETVNEIEKSWLKNISKVGITAGASTPDWIINEVIERLKIWEQECTKNS